MITTNHSCRTVTQAIMAGQSLLQRRVRAGDRTQAIALVGEFRPGRWAVTGDCAVFAPFSLADAQLVTRPVLLGGSRTERGDPDDVLRYGRWLVLLVAGFLRDFPSQWVVFRLR